MHMNAHGNSGTNDHFKNRCCHGCTNGHESSVKIRVFVANLLCVAAAQRFVICHGCTNGHELSVKIRVFVANLLFAAAAQLFVICHGCTNGHELSVKIRVFVAYT
jgi:hypothetical protein